MIMKILGIREELLSNNKARPNLLAYKRVIIKLSITLYLHFHKIVIWNYTINILDFILYTGFEKFAWN